MYAWIGSALSSRSPELLFARTYTRTAASCRRRSTRTSSSGSASWAGSRAGRRRWRWRSRSGSRHSGCRNTGASTRLRRGGVLSFEDMLDIATRQVEREEALSPDANRWLIRDTSPPYDPVLLPGTRTDAAIPRLDALAERPYARGVLCSPDFAFATGRHAPDRCLSHEAGRLVPEEELAHRSIAYRPVGGPLAVTRRGNRRAAWRPPSRFPITVMAMKPSAEPAPRFDGVTHEGSRRAGARPGAAPARARRAGGKRASCRPRPCATCTQAA